jgi:hypothetical protein
MSAPREPDERGANGQKTCDRLGFPVNKDNGCPLFAIEPTVNNVGDLLAIVKRVTQNQVVETSCWFESGQGHQSCIFVACAIQNRMSQGMPIRLPAPAPPPRQTR